MDIIDIKTSLPAGEELRITKVSNKMNERVPAFTCIGGNMDYTTQEESYPQLFTKLKNLSKNATWFFWSLVESRRPTDNIAVFKACNTCESRKVSRAYKELCNLNIIKRIQQQHYIINPKVILPQKGKYQDVKNHWDNL